MKKGDKIKIKATTPESRQTVDEHGEDWVVLIAPEGKYPAIIRSEETGYAMDLKPAFMFREIRQAVGRITEVAEKYT